MKAGFLTFSCVSFNQPAIWLSSGSKIVARGVSLMWVGGLRTACLGERSSSDGHSLLGDTKRARPVLCGHFGVHRAIGTSTCKGNARSSERAAHEQGLASSRSRTTHSSEGAGAGRAQTNVRTAVSRSSERVTVERRLRVPILRHCPLFGVSGE